MRRQGCPKKVSNVAADMGYPSLKSDQDNYSAIKRNETVSFAETWMYLETVIQSEVSQREKNKYIILLICGI